MTPNDDYSLLLFGDFLKAAVKDDSIEEFCNFAILYFARLYGLLYNYGTAAAALIQQIMTYTYFPVQKIASHPCH